MLPSNKKNKATAMICTPELQTYICNLFQFVFTKNYLKAKDHFFQTHARLLKNVRESTG